MERFSDMPKMLDLMTGPAFSVSDGIITYANSAAEGLLFVQGEPVSKYLDTGHEEYAAMKSGSLYLTLRTEGRVFGASVSGIGGFDVFLLEQEDTAQVLQAMALVARELRAPLSGMVISSRQLSQLAAQSCEEAVQPAAALNHSMHQMLRLIGNLSNAYRYSLEPAPQQELRDMTAVIGEIFSKAAALTDQTNVTVRFTNHSEPVMGLVDADRLECAICNILSNAIKFSPPGGTVDAKLTRKDNKLYLTVTDSGKGIPDSVLTNIFSRYTRQPNIEDGHYGIGLGMVMIRSAATTHGGTVLLEKNRKGGTKLTMSLGIRKSQDGVFASTRLKVDYTGGMDPSLIDLADVLPDDLYK